MGSRVVGNAHSLKILGLHGQSNAETMYARQTGPDRATTPYGANGVCVCVLPTTCQLRVAGFEKPMLLWASAEYVYF